MIISGLKRSESYLYSSYWSLIYALIQPQLTMIGFQNIPRIQHYKSSNRITITINVAFLPTVPMQATHLERLKCVLSLCSPSSKMVTQIVLTLLHVRFEMKGQTASCNYEWSHGMNHRGITVIFIHGPLYFRGPKVIGCLFVSWAAGCGCGDANKRSPAECGWIWKAAAKQHQNQRSVKWRNEIQSIMRLRDLRDAKQKKLIELSKE